MSKQEEKEEILAYKEAAKKQYTKSYQEKSLDELDKADNMYNILLNMSNKFYEKHNEQINVYLK